MMVLRRTGANACGHYTDPFSFQLRCTLVLLYLPMFKYVYAERPIRALLSNAMLSILNAASTFQEDSKEVRQDTIGAEFRF